MSAKLKRILGNGKGWPSKLSSGEWGMERDMYFMNG